MGGLITVLVKHSYWKMPIDKFSRLDDKSFVVLPRSQVVARMNIVG